jgi:crossover junction endodeoxyribonuclease RusA
MTVSLTVRGRPVPLQRSRTSSGRHYLPARSRAYRELVQAEWMAAGRPSLGAAPFTCSARFYGANARADLDNLVKAILDALNGLAFTDDSQLVCLSGCRKLAADAEGPRAVLELWP